jgi:DMSO/TMAO reductase YedYZ molybdopterin-dependent catalytic subunit
MKCSGHEERRLPPGQRAVSRAPPRHIGAIPKFDEKTWSLTVFGLVENSLNLSWQDFLGLPKVISVSDFHCVEGWSVLDQRWEGVPFRVIIEMAKPKREAKCVTFECDDGYTTSLPLTDLLDEDILLAYKLEDRFLKPEHGGPLRLLVPKKYAYKSAMWVRKIRFTSELESGHWESRGYSATADPWKEERYAR